MLNVQGWLRTRTVGQNQLIHRGKPHPIFCVAVFEQENNMQEELSRNELLKSNIKGILGQFTPYIPYVEFVICVVIVAKHDFQIKMGCKPSVSKDPTRTSTSLRQKESRVIHDEWLFKMGIGLRNLEMRIEGNFQMEYNRKTNLKKKHKVQQNILNMLGEMSEEMLEEMSGCFGCTTSTKEELAPEVSFFLTSLIPFFKESLTKTSFLRPKTLSMLFELSM